MMKNTLRKLRKKRFVTSIVIVLLLVFAIALIALLKPSLKSISIKKVLSKTTSLNASVIDGLSVGVSSNNYDEIKYQLKVNKNQNDQAIIIGTLTDSENKYARFKDINGAEITDNGKKITLATTKEKVTITVIIQNAPYGTVINPKFKINSQEEDKSKINVEPVIITGKSVEGRIYDEEGTFYKGLELSLNDDTGEVKRTYSRDNGEYVFSLGEINSYQIELEEDKYQIVRLSEETVDENKRILNIVVKEVEPFHVEIKKTINKLDLVVNGKKETYNYDDATKVVRSVKNAKTIEGSIYYNISIKNTGEVKGTLTVLKDVIPEGLSFDQSKNPGWVKDGDYLFYTVLEDKELGAFEKTNATLILDIVKTNEAKNYLNKAIASGQDYKYVAYYLNNRIYREEYVAASEKIEDINPGVENFDGWYTDREYTNKYDFKNTVTKDLILFGKIKNNKFTVTFIDKNPNNNEETILDIKEVEEGNSIDIVDAPTYRGYTFKCFKLNEKCYDNDDITEDVTLYTSYSTNKYGITYDLDDGILEEDNLDEYTVKDEFTLNNPSKEGYTFLGWTGTELSEVTQNVTILKGSIGDRKYTANFEINKSTLTVNPNGGVYLDNASAISYLENYGTVKQISDSYRRGYTFIRYNKTGGGTFHNGTYTFDNDDALLTAIYEINTYDITYEGLTNTEKTNLNNPVSYDVETDTFTLNNPSNRVDSNNNPSEDFLGWDDGNTVSINVTIEKGTIGHKTFRAVWQENDNNYDINYDLDGGSLEAGKSNPTTYKRSTNTFILNNPSKEGYTFLGWSGTGIENLSTSVTVEKGSAGARNYVAHYEVIPYTITYEGLTNTEKTNLNNPISYDVETDTFTLNNPSTRVDSNNNPSEDFLGWDDGNTVSINVTIEKGSTGNKSYTAVWQENEDDYGITYDYAGGSLESGKSNPSTYRRGTNTFTLNNPSKSGYTFLGWSGTGIENLSTSVTVEKGSAGARNYVAHYEVIPYTITYGGLTNTEKTNLNNPISYNVETETFTLNNPSTRVDSNNNPSEDFLGWDDGNGIPVTTVTITKGTTGNKSYTAVWQENENNYSITYNYNGGELEEGKTNPSTYRRGTSTFTLNNPSKSGYTFLGWSGTNLIGNTNIVVSIPKGSAGNRSYTANFEIIPYTITYSGLTDEEKTNINNPISYNVETNTFTLNNPSRTGYTFLGWSGTGINDKSTSVIVQKGSVGNRNYTANFEKIEYSITYTLNGGELEAGKTNPSKYLVDSDDITLNNPSKPGYTFLGWTGTGVEEASKTVSIPTGSIGHRNYLANYEPIEYTITYDYDGGELEEGKTNPSKYTIETPDITFNNPVKEGYTFTNYTSNNSIITGIPTGSTGNKALKANYEIRKYNVNYYNENDLYYSDEIDWNTTTTAPTTVPTKSHNVFLYWSENGSDPYNFETLIKDDKNLYAIYEEVEVPTITITPSLDNETNRTWVCSDANNNDCGVTVTLTSEHDDYALYYKIGNGEATLYTEPFKVYENTTVTAFSKKSNIYSEEVSNTVDNVDSIAPTINNPGTGAMSFDMSVSGTAQDAGSGVKKFTLFVKEKDALTYDDSFTYESETFNGIKDHAENYDHSFYNVKDNTEYIVLIRAEDYVGNISEREVEVKTHPYVARVVGKNNMLWYTVDPDTKEFIIEDGKEFLMFDSLQSAINYCENIECTIQTNPIIPVVNESVTIGENQNITIDLDGRGILSTSSATIVNNGKLKIVDRNPRLNGNNEHDGIGFVKNTVNKAIVNNNILVVGDGSSEASEIFIFPELDRPIIEGKTTAIEQNKEFHFYDGKIISDTLAITDNGDDVITQYSYNVIISEENNKNIATMDKVTDPEARIRSTYYAKLKSASADNAFDSSNKGTLTKEQSKFLSNIKQAGDYGFVYDAVNNSIYNGNQSTSNTTALSYLKIDLTNETEDKLIAFDTFVDSYNSNSYGYVSVSETYGSQGTQIFKITGNDNTGTKIYQLNKGKVYYLYFGFVKSGGSLSSFETFKVYNFGILSQRQGTSEFKLYDDINNYSFVKQEDGSYINSNNEIRNSYSHSYAIYDLRNVTSNMDLYINLSVDASVGYGYIYVSNNEEFSTYQNSYNQYKGTLTDVTNIFSLTPGKINYVHFCFLRTGWDSSKTETLKINSLGLSNSKGEDILPDSSIANNNNDNYYFIKADYVPGVWKDKAGNYNATVVGAEPNETSHGFTFDGNDYVQIFNGVTSEKLTTETVELEYSTTYGGNQTLYVGSTNQNIAIAIWDGRLVATNKSNHKTYSRPSNFADGNRHKIVVTYDNDIYNVYFDGTLLGEDSYTRSLYSTSDLLLGKKNTYDTLYYHGTIYDLKVYDRALTENEILNTASSTGLLLHLAGDDFKIEKEDVFYSNNTRVASSTAHSYLTYDLTNINEDKYLYINTSISSQLNYDIGYVQVTDSPNIPSNLSQSEIKISGELENQSAVFKLKKNSINYVHFVYQKNVNTDYGNDTFYINNIKYCNTLEDAYSVNNNDYTKESNYYFDKANINNEVDTIEILKDITLNTSLVVPQEEEVVLDLNGFTITSNMNDYVIKNNGKLTIKDSEYVEGMDDDLRGSIVSTITSPILNEENASLTISSAVININANSKTIIDNKGSLTVNNKGLLNANNNNTVGIFNSSLGRVTFNDGKINAKGSSSIGLINRSNTSSINGVNVETTNSKSIGIKNEATDDVSFDSLNITGAGLGFRELSMGDTIITNSSISSTGNNSITNISQDNLSKFIINNSHLSGQFTNNNSKKMVTIGNSTLGHIHNFLGNIDISGSYLTSIENSGEAVINNSTITGSNTLVTNTGSGDTWKTSQLSSKLLINNSTLNSTAASNDVNVIKNANTMIINNTNINNIGSAKPTAIYNQKNNFSDDWVYNKAVSYLSIIGNTTIDKNFGTAINNEANLTIGTNNGIANTTFDYAYSGKQDVFVAPETGLYKLETWGASGSESYHEGCNYGNCRIYYRGGYGAYASGTIMLNEGEKLYIHVGEAGSLGSVDNTIVGFYGSYNGGGTITGKMGDWSRATGAGGGATDISLSNEDNTWSYDNGVLTSTRSAESYEQRILVAGGGSGGHNSPNSYGGYSINPESSTLGYGSGNGGGGYYGGSYEYGGSSYASNTLSDVTLKTGEEEMPNYASSNKMIGNYGNGFARITLVSSIQVDTVSETPVISATNNGIIGNGIVNYYDGTINAKNAVTSGISIVPNDYDIYISTDNNSDENMVLVANVNSRPVEDGQEEFVARIGDAKYTTIQRAINASNNGDEIVLLVDINQQNTINVPANKDITIDYAGHTVKSYNSDYLYNNLGKLKIKNSSDDLNVNKFTGKKYIYNEGILEVNKIYIDNDIYSENILENNGGFVTLDHIKFDFGNHSNSEKVAITNSENGIINIVDSNLSLWGYNRMIDNSGELNLTNNVITNNNAFTFVTNEETGVALFDNNNYSIPGDKNYYSRHLLDNGGTATVKNMTTLINHISNTGTLTLDSNITPSGTIESSGLLIVESGAYSADFVISGTGIKIDNTDNLYSLIINNGTINKTLNISSTGISSIKGGTISVSNKNAINNTGAGIINLGINNQIVAPKETTKPVIIGKDYGIYTSNPSLMVNFYDGIVTGQKSYNVTINETETGYSIHRDYDDVNDMETKYLTSEPMFKNITQDISYNSLQELNTALANGSVNNNSTIQVLRSMTIVKNDVAITIPSNLKIVLDINGKYIDKNNNQMFIINGEMDVIDGTNTEGTIDSTNGSIFVNNGILNINKGIYISEKSSNESEIIINNGNLNISNGSFTKYYDILGDRDYHSGSIINNNGITSITGGKFYTNASHYLNGRYILSSTVFINNELGTLTVTGGQFDGIRSYTINVNKDSIGNYLTFFGSETNPKGELIYNYGTASIENITSYQSHIGLNEGTLTLDSINMPNIIQMNELLSYWNRGSIQNLINTGTLNVIDSEFTLHDTFVDNQGGNVSIIGSNIDRTDGYSSYTEDNSEYRKNSYLIKNTYNNSQNNKITIENSSLYHRGSGEVIDNRGKIEIDGSRVESNSNNAIKLNSASLVISNESIVTSACESTINASNSELIIKDNSSIISTTGRAINLSNSTLTLGEEIENDGTVSKVNPTIKGITYGIKNTNGIINFYDGVIMGKTNPVDGSINNIEHGYGLINDTDNDYKINYLDKIPIVQNITKATLIDEKKYYDLKTAFEEADNGDTLKLIVNYSNLPIDETAVNDNSITLDLNGKFIRQSNNILITNNGTINIVDTSDNNGGSIIGVSGTETFDNYGTINLIDAKVSTDHGVLLFNNNTGATLNVRDEGIINSSTSSTLIDNSGTTNIYNGAYLHNIRAHAIINRNELNIIDLNNDDDNSTSSEYIAPWIYTEGVDGSVMVNYTKAAIDTEYGATTTMYGGIYNNGETYETGTPSTAIIFRNSGTTIIKNLDNYSHNLGYSLGDLTIENSYFHNFEGEALFANNLTIKNTTIEITGHFNYSMSANNVTFNNVTVKGHDANAEYNALLISGGTIVIENNSFISYNNAGNIIHLNSSGSLLIKDSTINVTTSIYNSGTTTIDNSSITSVTGIITNIGTTTIQNGSSLLATDGNAIKTSGTVNVKENTSVVSQNGVGINVIEGGTLNIGEIGGTVSTETPYIEGTTFGVYRNTQDSNVNFYDGLIVGQTGPNAIYGGVSNIETGYETEDIVVLDPDTNISKHNEYLVVSTSSIAVAKVGTYSFASVGSITPSRALQNAINFAIGDGTSVRDVDLIANIDLVNDMYSVTASEPVTINLNGKTITTDSTYTLSSNITLNSNNLGASVFKLLSDVFDVSSKPKDIVIYELSDGSKLDTTKTYKLYKDGKLISLEKLELGKYRYKGNNEKLTPIKGRLYIDNLYKGLYKLESNDNKSIEFSIDENGTITGNVTENIIDSNSNESISNSEAELILTIQTGINKHYYWLLIIPITLIIILLIILNKNRKREI